MPLSELKLFHANPRQGDVGAIIQSLEAHGQYRALVVNTRTNEVLAGNHTLLALRQMGASDALCHFVDVDDDEATRIMLVDNRANDLASYDDAGLLELLKSLPGLDGTGFDGDAMDELAANLAAISADAPSLDATEQEIPETYEVIIQCSDEATQASLLERLAAEGYTCRALLS